MERISIVSNEFISVEFIPEHNIIQHTMHKPVSGPPLRKALDDGAAFLKQNGVTK